MSRLATLLAATTSELNSSAHLWAIIGGLAVSVRSEPRFTRDIDIAVAIENDDKAEQLIFRLQRRAFRVLAIVEQDDKERLATVRLTSSEEEAAGVVVDLLFASSGIESEVVSAAETIEVIPGQFAPVASVGHLIALKLLARD